MIVARAPASVASARPGITRAESTAASIAPDGERALDRHGLRCEMAPIARCSMRLLTVRGNDSRGGACGRPRATGNTMLDHSIPELP
jgi:hypothetical protein